MNYKIDKELPDQSGVEKTIALIDEYDIAASAYFIICKKYPDAVIVWKQGARVIRQQVPN